MLGPRTLIVAQGRPEVDFVRASQAIRMRGGNVAIEMDPEDEEIGGILLPDEALKRYVSDQATVLAVGPEVRGLVPGDRVFVLPYEGKRMRPFTLPGYSTTNRVRFVGVASPNPYAQFKKKASEVIVAKEIEDGGKRKLAPVWPWILLRRVPAKEHYGSLVLPDHMQYRQQIAVVASVPDGLPVRQSGETVDVQLAVGDAVVYHASSIQLIDFHGAQQLDLDGDPRDYCLSHYEDIWAVVPIPESA